MYRAIALTRPARHRSPILRSFMQQIGPNGKYNIITQNDGKLKTKKETPVMSVSASVFVPSGYIESSPKGYAAFSWWRFLQHSVSSTLGGVCHSIDDNNDI